MNVKLNNLFNKLDEVFSSIYVVPIAFCLGMIFYFVNLTSIAVFIFAITVVGVLVFCKNIRNIFPLIFYAPFYIKDIYSDPRWTVYGIAIGLVCLSLVLFFIKGITKNRHCLKKGKMFYPLIIADVAFLLGGVMGFFSIRTFAITLGFSVVAYLLYWMALNFTENMKKHLFFSFVIGAFFLILQTIILKLTNDGKPFSELIIWIGSQNVNVASLFALLGVVSCFGLGTSKKYDYIYFLLACLLSVGIVIMHCRMVMFTCLVFMVIATIYMLIKSPNKILFLEIFGGLVVVCIILYFSLRGQIKGVISEYLNGDFTGTGGRKSLWTWCIEQFDKNFLFGVGFVAGENLPGYSQNPKDIILAHNTVIQWLVSLGLIGTLLMVFFYIGKYKIMLERINFSNLFTLATILIIEINGIMDQAPSMDIFVYILTLVLLSVMEKEPKAQENDPLRKQDFKLKSTTKEELVEQII